MIGYPTTTTGIRGTLGYCAPEVLGGKISWQQNPTACDAYAIGVMIAELLAGRLYTDRHKLLEALDMALPPNDVWCELLAGLAVQLLSDDPSRRPDMVRIMQHDFFNPNQVPIHAAGGLASLMDTKFVTFQKHMSEKRKAAAAKWTKPKAAQVSAGDENGLPLALLNHYKNQQPITNPLTLLVSGVSKPLPAALDGLPKVAIELGLLVSHQQEERARNRQAQDAGDTQLFATFLPATDAVLTAEQERLLEALGRCWAKALLEGIHIPIELCSFVHWYLLASSTSPVEAGISCSDALLMYQTYHPRDSNQLRNTLLAQHGGGDLLLMTAEMLEPALKQPNRPITDANKHDLVREAVLYKMWRSRARGLAALRRGMVESSELKAEIQSFAGCPRSFGALFFGQWAYSAPQELAKLVWFDNNVPEDLAQAFLKLIHNLSEVSLRTFWAAATGSLIINEGMRLIVMLPENQAASPKAADGNIDTIEFIPSARIVILPELESRDDVPLDWVLGQRLIYALNLGDNAYSSQAQQRARLSAREFQDIMKAFRGEVVQGAFHIHQCGYPYLIGECHGAMEEGRCQGCGGVLGGTRHTLRNDNFHLPLFGAQPTAWMGSRMGEQLPQATRAAAEAAGLLAGTSGQAAVSDVPRTFVVQRLPPR